MTARLLGPTNTEGLRAFDAQRDLSALADLIEVAFADEHDSDVAEIARDLRWLAGARWLVWLLNALGSRSSPLLHGYVWIADGRLVGNVTLTLEDRARRLWAISNVAVHPDYQGHGIARQLIAAALAELRRQGACTATLQVRPNNDRARHLYTDYGFAAYDTIADLRLSPAEWRAWIAPHIAGLRRRNAQDLPQLHRLWVAVLPEGARTMRRAPFPPPGHRQWSRWLSQLFSGMSETEYVVERQGEIVAWLRVSPHSLGPHRLRLEVAPTARGSLEADLVRAGLALLSSAPPHDVLASVSTSHPEAIDALHAHGFQTERTLEQMALRLTDACQER